MEAIKAQLTHEMNEAAFAKDYAEQQIAQWQEKKRQSYQLYYQKKAELKTLTEKTTEQ